MKKGTRLVIMVAIAAVVGLAFGPTQASAATLVVSAVAGPAPCNSPSHATIQDAVDAAAAGDSILVCPGTYVEDLEITTNDLSIAAVDRANKANTVIRGTLVAPGPFPDCGLAAGVAGPKWANINISANGVTITGFTIQSPAVSVGQYSCGLIVDGNNNNIYENAFKVSCGDPGSPAIQTWAMTNGPIGSVDGLSIVANSFDSSTLDPEHACLGYEAIFINPQTKAPSTNPVTIVHNTFSGKMYRGIGVYDRDWTDIKYNTLETTLKVVKGDPNFGTFPVGIKVWEGSNSVVLGNEITSHGKKRQFANGIWLNPNTSNNVVAKNVVKHSGVWDCRDESTGSRTAGTNNLWQDNAGKKDSPKGICRGHIDHDDDDQ